MKQFTVPGRDEVSPANQANFDALKNALGMTPNLYAYMGRSDSGLSKYLSFQGAKTSLSNKEKEAVNLVVSQVNGCIYCQSAHTVLGKMNGFSEDEIIKIRGGHASNPKLDALVVLAKDVTERKGHVPETSLNAFFSAGYNEGNLVDLVLQVSDKVAMNYLHNLTSIPVDFPLAQPLDAVTA